MAPTAVAPAQPTTRSRANIIRGLTASRRIHPLIDHNSCRLCAIPQLAEHYRGFPNCYPCHRQLDRYDHALSDLHPLAYTTARWPLGTAIRRFKDRDGADQTAPLALPLAAILSAYLEHQLPRLNPPHGFDLLVPVPTSRPVIAASLARAKTEGWFAPELATDVAKARSGYPRQRERTAADRRLLAGKWIVNDPDRIAGRSVLVLDDIATTGATLHSFAKALVQHGAATVHAIVLALNVAKDGLWIAPLLDRAIDAGTHWSPMRGKHDVFFPPPRSGLRLISPCPTPRQSPNTTPSLTHPHDAEPHHTPTAA